MISLSLMTRSLGQVKDCSNGLPATRITLPSPRLGHRQPRIPKPAPRAAICATALLPAEPLLWERFLGNPVFRSWRRYFR